MTLCPIAMVSGCKSCPVFKVCPGKSIIGDSKKEEPAKPEKEGSKES
ncbi:MULTISPECIES: hypothetical protein [unclassified Oleiphilus]|nr:MULTISPECIES: hypothetical protein [unclassified Oleiphilus]